MDFADYCVQGSPEEIGATGSRYGFVSELQRVAFMFAIENLHEHGAMRLHHGKAAGVDEAAHMRCFRLRSSGMTVSVHPPLNTRHIARGLPLWAGCVEYAPKSYHARDKDIATSSGCLIAAPQYPEKDPRSKRSGTWLTVRFARAEGASVYAVDEQGNITDESDPDRSSA